MNIFKIGFRYFPPSIKPAQRYHSIVRLILYHMVVFARKFMKVYTSKKILLLKNGGIFRPLPNKLLGRENGACFKTIFFFTWILVDSLANTTTQLPV